MRIYIQAGKPAHKKITQSITCVCDWAAWCWRCGGDGFSEGQESHLDKVAKVVFFSPDYAISEMVLQEIFGSIGLLAL